MNSLIEQLDNADLWKHGEVNTDKIGRLSRHDITDFREEAAELTAIGNSSSSLQSPFIQVSSISLAGGRQPCAGYNCRAKKLRQLTNYAALYADRVYIDNLLTARRFPKAKEADAQRYFAEDLQLLLGLRPLIEGGQIVPVTVEPHLLCSLLS